MPRAHPFRIHEPGPRQFVNELLGNRAFERGDALALHRPLELHLQLSSGCNLDCYMCHEHLRPEGTRHGKGMKFLSEEVLARIEREVLPYSSRLHLGVGGEPMLAPYFLELVERAHAQNQRIHLTTNGTRIATERVAEVLARCVNTLEISADGATAETYERIRGGASFARLKKNIELLNKHRFLRDPEDRPKLSLCMVLMQSNVHELPRFVELAAELAADSVAAWPVIPVTEEGRADRLDLEHARPFVLAARERALALGIELDLPFDHGADAEESPREDRTATLRRLAQLEKDGQEKSPGRHYCHMPSVALYVFWDGRAYPCANPRAHQGEALGDFSSQDFAQIWNGLRFRNLRAGLATGDAPEVCRSCPILHRSAGPLEGEVSDMVTWFGERDLAPAKELSGGLQLVDDAVSSGLATHVHERYFKLLGYSHLLEREVHEQGSAIERLTHERDSARLHLDALIAERGHLKAHVEVLARDREGLAGHVCTLEHERPQLVAHAKDLQTERDALAGHLRTLEHERPQIVAVAKDLRAEREALAAHARTLERERPQLVAHVKDLETERDALAGHARTLEAQTRGLEAHRRALEAHTRSLEEHARTLEAQRNAHTAHARELELEVHRLGRDVERTGHQRDAARLELELRLEDGRQAAAEALVFARERKALALHAVNLETEREQLVRHAANLARILERTRALAIHRVLSTAKDFFVRPRPRAPFVYVPPWVADGSRRDGEPPARLDA